MSSRDKGSSQTVSKFPHPITVEWCHRIKNQLNCHMADVDELGMSVREGYLATNHTNQKALLRRVSHTVTSSCSHPRRRSFVKQSDSFTLEAHFTSPLAVAR